MQNLYRGKVSDTIAAELVKRIKIYHPYGIVGSLPWLNANGAKMEYGGEPDAQQLLELSKNIKTFTEGNDPESSGLVGIKEHMRNADKIIYLGFAFEDLNMKLLNPKIQANMKNRTCFATIYGFSDYDGEVIENQIKNFYPGNLVTVYKARKKCFELFDEYKKSIAFEY